MFTSISFIAVGAFILTLGVVVYEVFLLKKKKQVDPTDQKTVQLPDYAQDPQAVQNISAVPNALPENGPALVEEQAPMRARSLPSKKVFIMLALLGILLIGAIAGAALFLNNAAKNSETKKAVVDTTSPTPTKKSELRIVPTSSSPSSTPTPVITITIESESEVEESSSSASTNNSSSKGGDTESSSSATITSSPTPSESNTPLPTDSEMPTAGIIQHTLLLGAISIFFIVLAFIL